MREGGRQESQNMTGAKQEKHCKYRITLNKIFLQTTNDKNN